MPESWIWALENAALSLPASAKEVMHFHVAVREGRRKKCLLLNEQPGLLSKSLDFIRP
jgi:hypothetical protein